MTNELKNLLSDRADRGEHRGATTVLESARDAAGGPGPAASRRWNPALAFGAAAAAIVAIVGAAVLLTGSDDPTATTDPAVAATTAAPTTIEAPPTTTGDTTTPPVVSPPAVQDPIEWYRLTIADTGRVQSIALGGPGIVAVGAVEDAVAIWTSSDATEWSRVPHDEVLFGFGDGWLEMQDIAAGPEGLVVIGSTEIGLERTATVWLSSDGIAWERIDLDSNELGLDGPVVLNAVTHGAAGYVAVGWTTPPDQPWMLDDHVVLRSADGRTWEAAVDLDELPLGGMWDVTAGGPGYVAVGVDWSITGVAHAGVWVSDDGIRWALADPAGVACVVCDDIELMNAVTTDGIRLIATGGAGSLVWVSDDGIEWSILGSHDPDGTGSWAAALTASDDRIVAVGAIELPPDPEPEGAAAWVSEDRGLTWSASMLPEAVFGGAGGTMAMSGVVDLDDRYVAVGDWNGEATVWIGQWNGADE
jgi:hypothetical protein